MTFSIAGRCARTGMLGCVVTTSNMGVGSRCAWAEAGVGAALTQNRTDPRLGPIMLGQLRRGRAPEAIVKELEKSDPNLKWRQLALIDKDGQAAFFNGEDHLDPQGPGRPRLRGRRQHHPHPRWSMTWSKASSTAPTSRSPNGWCAPSRRAKPPAAS